MRWYLALLLVGCNPQDATVEGKWAIWLAGNSSASVTEDKVDVSGMSSIDCYWGEDDIHYVGSSSDAPSCDDLALTAWQDWILDDGYYVDSGDLAPWRTEAIMNGEGDFQLSVHTDLGSGNDLRFTVAIKPDFAPVVCTTDDNGEAVIEYVDGANWVDEWSADEGDYKIYYLNSGALQFNPAEDVNSSTAQQDGANYWYLDTPYRSGFAYAKWAEDYFNSYPTDYLWDDPQHCRKREKTRVFYPGQFFGDPSGYFNDKCDEDVSYTTAGEYLGAIADDLTSRSETWTEQWNSLYLLPSDTTFEYRIENNDWRPIDDVAAGIDGWAEVNSSWVRIKKSSDLKVGGSAEGDFQIYFAGTESTSHMLVKGTFKVEEIGEDKWGYTELEDDQRAENNTPFCGGAAMPE